MTITNDFFNRLEGTWQNKVNGVWQDNWGWNFITQPEQANPAIEDFKMRSDPMRETITFRPIGTPRNLGITGEAGFWFAMAYEAGIETPQGQDIHHEMGHFLLNVLEPDPDNGDVTGQTPQELQGNILRQASIPRANSMLTAGILKPGSVTSAIASQAEPFYSAKPIATDTDLQDQIEVAFGVQNNNIQAAGGPDMTQPLEWLKMIEPDDGTDIDWEFTFRVDEEPSQMASGQRVANPVGIGNLLSDFWIGKRTHDGEEREILQYAQLVNLLFNAMKWPHVAVNTLVKQ